MNQFNFSDEDVFALAEELKTLFVQFKESKSSKTTAMSADDLAKFLVRWKEVTQKLSDEERSKEVQRVLNQLAQDRVLIENLEKNLEKNLKENYYDKKDMRFHFLVLGMVSIAASMFGPEVMTLLKYVISLIPK